MRASCRLGPFIRVAFLVAACAVMAPAPSDAAPSVRAELGTDPPVDAWLGVLIEGPARVRLTSSIGLVPGPYLFAMRKIGEQVVPDFAGGLARVAEASLSNSAVWRIHLGWRPFASRGFIFHIGWSAISMRAGANASFFMAGVYEQELDPEIRETSDKVQAVAIAELQMLDLGLGWEWQLKGPLYLRLLLGWSFAQIVDVHANIDWQPGTDVDPDQAAKVEVLVDDYLSESLRSSGHPPRVVFALGWRFPAP